MFRTTTYHAASVTATNIVFCCPEMVTAKPRPAAVSYILSVIDDIEELDIVRHFNRIQKSFSKKTQTEYEKRWNGRYYRNRKEYEHRSKELFVQTRTYFSRL